jgi:hypothetical protein
MMFDFSKFYHGLLNRTDYFNNYWEQFPIGRLMRYKKETLALLKENIKNKDEKGLSCTIAVIYNDGADRDYTEILLSLLEESWHMLEEDIVGILEIIKDPRSIDKLYALIIDIPDYDDMRALAKKCMWALSTIKTPQAREKLVLLQGSNDPIIKENATFQLEHVINQK